MPGHGALTYPPPGRIKRFSARREMSQAEAVRRGAEPYLDRFPEEVDPRVGWPLPPARSCGVIPAPEEASTGRADPRGHLTWERHLHCFSIMVKTQVQFPDALYERIKRFAARREMSLAEIVRRGAEQYLDRFPEEVDPRAGWQLPPARACGGFLAPEEAWTALAHEPDGDEGTHPAAR